MLYGFRRRNAQNEKYKHNEWQKAEAAHNTAMKVFHALPDAERQQVFAVFFPKIADVFEAAWQLMDRIPYQDSYVRVAFRAPKSSEVTHARRDSLFLHAIGNLPEYADVDIVWFAEYAAYFGYYSAWFGYLFAAAIDMGGETGDKVYNTLIDSANGTHEIGATGRHVFTALLCASRPDGWEFCEKYLLAAQCNEGLRRVVLESIDEAHSECRNR